MSPYREHKGHATEAYVYCFAVVVWQYNNIVEVSYKECAANEMPELPTTLFERITQDYQFCIGYTLVYII